MKRAILLAALLSLGACASTSPQVQTRYTMDAAGNLAQEQYIVEASDTGSKVAESAMIIGLGILGFYFAGELFGVWDDDDDPAPAASGPFVLPASGESTSSYTNSYILPDYQVVN